MKSFEIISVFTYIFSSLIPKKKNRWIFGAWFGNSISDNTKSLYDYVDKNMPQIEKVWVVSDPKKANISGCKIVKRNSLYSLIYILTAKVAIMNQGFGDFAAYNFLGGTYKVQLWHGVAWKKIGRDALENKTKLYNKIFNFINRYDLYIAPSDKYKSNLISAFGALDNQIVLSGQPRNVCLFSNEFIKDCKNSISKELNIKNKRVIVYMPTFRDKTNNVFSFHKLENDERFVRLAKKHNFIVVEKTHYKTTMNNVLENDNKYVYGLPNTNAEKLLGAADILITDYSSCFFDYLITNRPIIHFVYDYEYYKNLDRGLYYDLEEVAAGLVAFNQNELLEAIDKSITDDQFGPKRKEIRDNFITYESIDNNKIIVDTIMKKLTRTI